jgi:hypothetical protein
MESKECQDLMDRFIEEKPQIWCVNIPSHTVRFAANLA